MSEFKFSCPHCEQHMQSDEKLSGKQIECPACHHLIRIPPSPAETARSEPSVESGRTWDTFVPKPTSPKTTSSKPKTGPAGPGTPQPARSLFQKLAGLFSGKGRQ
jgi:hypothetical protein